MQIGIQFGQAVKDGQFVQSYPINLDHELNRTLASEGQLVTARGADVAITGTGKDRDGIDWEGVQYRVMGSRLVRVESDETLTDIGDVGDDGEPAQFAFSFDRLAIASARKLYYYDRTTLTEVTDIDLGEVLDVTWIDGYFATTDGTSVVVTELNDPADVDPLKYGSAERDPDPLVAVIKHREELVGVGRYSIQFFRNVGGIGFPFQNIQGALVPYGAIHAKAVVHVFDTFAFIGSNREEPLGVYMYINGGATRISTEEIDDLIAEANEGDLEIEARRYGHEQQIVVHMGDVSAALSLKASNQTGQNTWNILHSGFFGPYTLRHAVLVGGTHWVGELEGTRLGKLSRDTDTHFGVVTHWRFDAGVLYNENNGLIVNELELLGQWRQAGNEMFLSATHDGEVWSKEVARSAVGRRQRAIWRPGIRFGQIGGFRLRGYQKASIARADIMGEGLAA